MNKLFQNNDLQDTYKITTWYCKIYHRFCGCCRNKKNT